MVNALPNRGIGESAEAQKHSVTAEPSGYCVSRGGLRHFPANASDLYNRVRAHLFHGKFQNGFEQADGGIANGKLRGVHSNGDSTGTGRQIITRQSALPTLIQSAFLIEC